MTFKEYLSIYISTVQKILDLQIESIKLRRSNIKKNSVYQDLKHSEIQKFSASSQVYNKIHDIVTNLLTLTEMCKFGYSAQITSLIDNFKNVVSNYPGFIKQNIDSITNKDYNDALEKLKQINDFTLRNALISCFNTVYNIS